MLLLIVVGVVWLLYGWAGGSSVLRLTRRRGDSRSHAEPRSSRRTKLRQKLPELRFILLVVLTDHQSPVRQYAFLNPFDTKTEMIQ